MDLLLEKHLGRQEIYIIPCNLPGRPQPHERTTTRSGSCPFPCLRVCYDVWKLESSMLKKTYLSSAYNGLQQCSFCCPNPSCISSTSPQNLPAQRARPQSQPSNKRRRVSEPSTWISARGYATARDGKGTDFRDNMNWPCRSGKKAGDTNPFIPSPYEIFDMHRTARYGKQTKMKYYELVKIYHPDRSGLFPASQELSHPERLERVNIATV